MERRYRRAGRDKNGCLEAQDSIAPQPSGQSNHLLKQFVQKNAKTLIVLLGTHKQKTTVPLVKSPQRLQGRVGQRAHDSQIGARRRGTPKCVYVTLSTWIFGRQRPQRVEIKQFQIAQIMREAKRLPPERSVKQLRIYVKVIHSSPRIIRAFRDPSRRQSNKRCHISTTGSSNCVRAQVQRCQFYSFA